MAKPSCRDKVCIAHAVLYHLEVDATKMEEEEIPVNMVAMSLHPVEA